MTAYDELVARKKVLVEELETLGRFEKYKPLPGTDAVARVGITLIVDGHCRSEFRSKSPAVIAAISTLYNQLISEHTDELAVINTKLDAVELLLKR